MRSSATPFSAFSARTNPARSRGSLRTAVAALVFLHFFTGSAAALGFQVVFSNSTYNTKAGDTFSDLLAQHSSETVIQSTQTQGLENVSTSVYAGGVTRDYSILMTTTLDVAVAGTYTFQVGTDWGRGGATALIDNTTGTILSERVINSDIWWANNWNNPDVFTTTFDFNIGDSYTLAWVGFEGCCGGSSTIRFSVDGGVYLPLTQNNFQSYTAAVPEPAPALLFALGLTGLASVRRRQR